MITPTPDELFQTAIDETINQAVDYLKLFPKNPDKRIDIASSLAVFYLWGIEMARRVESRFPDVEFDRERFLDEISS